MKRATQHMVEQRYEQRIISESSATNRRWLQKAFLAAGALIAVVLLIISSITSLTEYAVVALAQQERGVVALIAGLQLILLAISGDENF